MAERRSGRSRGERSEGGARHESEARSEDDGATDSAADGVAGEVRPAQPAAHHFELVAGALCLDFVNTVGDRSGTRRYVRNYLQHFEDVIAWGLQTSTLGERDATALHALAAQHADAAAMALTRAVDLRETLHAVFAPIAAGRPIKRDALATLNERLPALLAQSRLAITPDDLVCHWTFDATHVDPVGASRDLHAQHPHPQEIGGFDRVIWSVARSAADLLTSGDLRYVHQCALETCGWLFLDLSKNKTRRWCAMKMCGNKAKVRHHRATQRRIGV
jgi:predicted RNA-binding Zn ribbon-like protein